MKGCKTVVAAPVCFALIALFAAAGCNRFSAVPVLTVHLRCDTEASGTLSATLIPPNGQPEKLETFDIKTSCQAGKIELTDYRREKNVRFAFERGIEKSDLSSEYGSTIQSDQNGFYMFLKITNSAPFIFNDGI